MSYFPDNDWKAIQPEQAGISTLLLNNLLNRVENENMNLHGLVLLHNGYIVLEKYWDSSYKEKPEHVFSVTKAVVSLITGIAISEKLLDVESTIISYFPEISLKNKNINENLRKLKIKHLLTMSSGHEKDTDWGCLNAVVNYLNTPIPNEPGCHFAYLNGSATMISAIIQKVTGKRLVDYADEKLFSKIGIEKPQWNANPDGICYGGTGVWFKTRDIARIGLLLLNQGKWNDAQIVPKDYIVKATSTLRSSFIENDPNSTAGYGYLFWQNTPTLSGYRITGWNGHHSIVLPKYNIVCATTAEGDMYQFLHALDEEVINHS